MINYKLKVIMITVIAIIVLPGCAEKEIVIEKEETEVQEESYDSTEQIALGAQYLEEIRYEEALATYNSILTMAGDNPDAYLGIAEVYLRQGEYDTALEYAQRGYETTGDARLSDMIDMIESGNIVDSKDRILRETAYDDIGNIIWWHDFTYNDLWQQNSITAYDRNGNVIKRLELTYDEMGNALNDYWEMRNPGDELDGYIARAEKEWENGLCIKEICYGFTENFSKSTFYYEYDENGNEKRQIEYIGDNKNPSSESRSYYDDKNRLIKVETEDYYDKEYNYTDTYEYNDEGLVARMNIYNAQNELERYYTYEYNDKGQQVRKNIFDGDGVLLQDLE